MHPWLFGRQRIEGSPRSQKRSPVNGDESKNGPHLENIEIWASGPPIFFKIDLSASFKSRIWNDNNASEGNISWELE